MFNGSTWHGQGVNSSTRSRRSLQGAFSPGLARAAWSDGVPREILPAMTALLTRSARETAYLTAGLLTSVLAFTVWVAAVTLSCSHGSSANDSAVSRIATMSVSAETVARPNAAPAGALAGPTLAVDKAYTAVGFGMPTHGWFDFIKNDPPLAAGAP